MDFLFLDIVLISRGFRGERIRQSHVLLILTGMDWIGPDRTGLASLSMDGSGVLLCLSVFLLF